MRLPNRFIPRKLLAAAASLAALTATAPVAGQPPGDDASPASPLPPTDGGEVDGEHRDVEPTHADPQASPPPRESPHDDALFAQDALKVATSVALAATGAFGVISAINQPTAFGDGQCSDDGVPPDRGEGIGGRWGCDGINIVHGGLGVGTALLYTAEQVTGLVIPGDEPDYGALHQALTYTHVGGMVLTPAVGLLASNPRVFGIDDSADAAWPKTGRTIHLSLALLTAASYWATTIIELASSPSERASARRAGKGGAWNAW